MSNHLTELVFILDRSGSMHGLEKDTLGGFNSMIEKQRKTEEKVLVTTVLFDSEVEVLHDRLPIRQVRPMTEKEYEAGGCTALLDAVGHTIHRIGMVHKYARQEDVPRHTMFVIITDGEENASRFYGYDDVKKMVEKEKSKYGWEFIFLGANMDAIGAAASIGIDEDRAAQYLCDEIGIQKNFEAVDQIVECCCVSEKKPLSKAWKKGIEADFEKRGR